MIGMTGMGDETQLAGGERVPEDGVGACPADEHDIALFETARRDLGRLRVPLFLRGDDPHERLYVAAFDDTRNDIPGNPVQATNVAGLARQIREAASAGNRRIAGGLAGDDMQAAGGDPDDVFGRADEPRIEEMYAKLARQVHEWRREDPLARIRIAAIGAGHGAGLVVGFARLVHERGIGDPSGMRQADDAAGRRTIEYAGPSLVAPGQVAQVVGLFDPIAGGSRQREPRLPASVISGFQVTAGGEHRGPMQSTGLIDVGMTVDGRFLAVVAAGAHADIAGGRHHRDGLSVRAGNLMVDYLNALAAAPFLGKRPEPAGPGMNVVHVADEGLLLQRVWRKVDRQQVSGVAETPATSHVCRIVAECRNAEPRDEALASQFEYRRAAIGQPPADAARLDPPLRVDATAPGHPDHALLLQGVAATGRLEDRLHRVRDLNTDRLATVLVAAAKRAELRRIDHVVLSDTGSHAFAVEGDLDSPFRRVARAETNSAINTPVGDSLARIGTVALRGRSHGQRPDAPASREDEPAPPRTHSR